MEFSAPSGCTTVIRTSPVFDVENTLKCLVHLLFMRDGAVERSALVMYLYFLVSYCMNSHSRMQCMSRDA